MSEKTVSETRIGSISWTTAESLIVHALLYGLAVLFLVPYLWMVTTSIKPRSDIVSPKMEWIPSGIIVDHYISLLTDSLIIEWTINTIIIASATTLLILLVDSLIAFSLTRLDWPGQQYVLGLIIASFMVPGFVNIIPLYTLMTDLGLVNSFLAVILPSAAGPLGVFLLVQFFRDIPDELQEAAQLDGFSTFRIYALLIMPLSKSVLTALGLFVFIWNWNQFLWPLIVLQKETAYTLPLGLVTLYSTYTYQPGLVMASSVLASLPLFLVFLLFQKQLISAVKMQGVT